MAATALGILQACYEEAAKFANERVLYGKPIGFLQAISFAVAEIYTELDICRLLCYRASWMKDQNMRFDTESAMAKSYTCEAAANCAKKAIEIHGAYGIMQEYKVQRLLRDAMVTISAGGTGQIGKVVIGTVAGDIHDIGLNIVDFMLDVNGFEVYNLGVDVPAATVMVIEHAERFGLAQLHQLRGRVGRGSRESFCMLLYKAPLGETARQRLEMMEETEDGFLIAEKDLELRGGGEVLGARQSGTPGFRVAEVPGFETLLSAARDDARMVLSSDPMLSSPRGQALRTLLYIFECDEAVRLFRAA